MPSEATVSGGHRLHPASLLFSLGAAARRLLVPGIVILFASRGGGNTDIWLMLMFLPAALHALMKYMSFRYRFAADELVVREGIIFRNERHIPYARIQNINLVQNPLHRLLRVSEVHLETAGGDKPEAVMQVLSTKAIERLRSSIFTGREAGAAVDVSTRDGLASDVPAAGTRPADLTTTLLELPLREVVLYGLLSNRGIAVVAAAMGAVWQFDLVEFDDNLLTVAGREIGIPDIPQPGLWTGVLLAVGGLLAALVLLRLFSVLLAVVKFSGFALRLRGEDLRAEYGLLTRISAAIPRKRIQLLSMRSSPLYRRFQRAAVQIETAGGSNEGEGAAVDRLWLAPLMPSAQIPRLVEQVLPEIDFDAVAWHPLAPSTRRRVFVRTSVLALPATAVGSLALGWWALLIPGVLIPLAWLHASMFVKHAAYGVTPTAVAYRSGWWVRRTSAVLFNKIQALSLVQSPFDRRHGTASLHVDTAGAGKIGHRIHMDFLMLGDAAPLLDRLSREAGQTVFRW